MLSSSQKHSLGYSISNIKKVLSGSIIATQKSFFTYCIKALFQLLQNGHTQSLRHLEYIKLNFCL